MTASMGGASPWAALQAWEDWAFHLAMAPMRTWSLALDAMGAAARVGAYAIDPSAARADRAPYELSPSDRRFRDQQWRMPPFDALAQAQLAREALWRSATEPLAGVRAHHLRRVRFMGEQWQHATAPSNFAWSNPTILDAYWRTGGASSLQGWSNLADDTIRLATGQRFFGAEAHEVGRDLAATPGSVVFRNELMELIQYTPTTTEVRAEPILIVPAWIMKYYILDLSPRNSLITYLVDQGYTVFCISWKNPDAGDRDLSFDDYRELGVLAALDAVNAIVPEHEIHGVGYCLGGTMLAVAAAGLEHEPKRRLRSLTLLAAQTDFSEAGELMMFIDESQIAALEDVMDEQGYLDARQMAGAFYALRANDLLWERIVERYLIGLRKPATELDAWLADATRMPARMHSEYLRWLFLENRLAQGNFEIDHTPISLKDLRMPIFAVGAERDHIAPWRSVHKIALFASAETTFVLSGGGHNTAIVSPPDKPRAYFRIHKAGECDDYVETDEWLAASSLVTGSWWPAWKTWLDNHSTGEFLPAPRALGAPSAGYHPQESAPGLYVRQA
jgi:polyhydroxyalkanoate synthase subunit PhaC